MNACCMHCYKKYINEDGTVDYERLAELLSEGQDQKVDVQELKEADTAEVIEFCTCRCHIDGKNILH